MTGGRAARARGRQAAARCRFLSLAMALALCLAAKAAVAEPAPSFRLCADPDNLPFSAAKGEPPGFYIELGRAIAARLGRPFEPVWEPTYFARRAVRLSLLKGRCDGFIGLPDEPDLMGTKLIFSKPVLALGYALVLPQGMSVKSLADLAGRRVAVQYASSPQNLLATRDDVPMVTVLSPEEAMRDLAEAKADAAFIWGPSAGWINKTKSGGAYEVIPIAGPHMQWQAAIAFASAETPLRDQVDAAIDALAPSIAALMTKYGFPKDTPLALAGAEPAAAESRPATAPQPVRATPAVDSAAAGHKLFNENCSHCHGPDAVQGERRRNLRLLQHRYGEDFDQVFMNTVTHGRVTKGMPNWSGVLTDEQFHEILAYLHSVQEP